MSEMRTPLSRVRGLGSAKKARSIFGFNVSQRWLIFRLPSFLLVQWLHMQGLIM